MHDNGAMMCPFAWWEVLPHYGAPCNAAACGASTHADAGAAAVAAALGARVQSSWHPLLVAECQCTVYLGLGWKSPGALHHLWHFESNVSALTAQGGMNQTAVDSLWGWKSGAHLIGRIWVRGRVSARYCVARQREAAQCCRAVGKLNFFAFRGSDFERGRAVHSVRVLIANEAPARPADFLHIPATVKGCDPFIPKGCWVL